jgi:iron complex transport system substrate-binding protein
MKRFIAILLALMLIFAVTACAKGSDAGPETASPSAAAPSPSVSPSETAETPEAGAPAEWPKTVTDVLGNTLTLDEPVKGVAGTHNPTMNLAIVIGGGGKYIKGFGNKEMADELYSIVFPELAGDVTQIGKGKNVNYETVVQVAPDLAILPERFSYMMEEFKAVNVDALVVLSSEESFGSLMNSLTLMGSILDEDERAAEIVAMMQDIIDGVKTATADVSEADKPSVMFLGSSSMLSVATDSLIQTEIMEAAGGVNAVKGLDVYGDFAEVSAEEIVGWNPDIIWIPQYADYTVEDVLNNEAYANLTAVKNGAVYQFPSALEPWDYPTASCVLGLAWAASNLYPERYTADDLMTAADNFYNLIYGRTFTAEQLGIR